MEGLVILAYTNEHEAGLRGTACAYELGSDMKTPVWKSRVTDWELPPGFIERGLSVSGFSVSFLQIDNYFADTPEDEILIVYAHFPTSAALLRICDQRGRTLYQIWHDGGFYNAQWWQEKQQLILCGSNSEVYWKGRGYPDAIFNYPEIIMSLRPEMNYVSTTWTSPSVDNEMRSVLWYRCLLPPELGMTFVSISTAPRMQYMDYKSALIVVRDYRNAGIGIYFDEYGKENIDMRIFSDAWIMDPKLNTGVLPYLGELPPMLPGVQTPYQIAIEAVQKKNNE